MARAATGARRRGTRARIFHLDRRDGKKSGGEEDGRGIRRGRVRARQSRAPTFAQVPGACAIVVQRSGSADRARLRQSAPTRFQSDRSLTLGKTAPSIGNQTARRSYVTADSGRPRAKKGVYFFRWSLTRTALPWERGTSPGDLTSTRQVTPINDLIWLDTSSALRPRSPSAIPASGASSTSTIMASSAPSRVKMI